MKGDMCMYKIFNEDCRVTLKKMEDKSINGIMTSPFYNTSRSTKTYNTLTSKDGYTHRYDGHSDNLSDGEYIEFTLDLFNEFDRVIKENGCVLYNISYGSENTHLMWLVIADIIRKTNWIVADDIIWKKKSAIPNNRSSNKLTRIVEHVFVFCRKDEFRTFNCNKEVVSLSKVGQKNYKNYFNFVEAKNNDGANNLNKATYSSDLCNQLLSLYFKKGDVIYDPFNGTGTTGVACLRLEMKYIGSEISKAQCDYSIERLEHVKEELNQQMSFL